MPTYEYECETCGDVFDMFQSIKAKPLRKADCEKCGSKQPVKRLIGTGGGVIFKGSGFYQTDYRSEGYKKAAESETKSGKGDTADKGGESKKSESKAESKSTESKAEKPKKKSPKAE